MKTTRRSFLALVAAVLFSTHLSLAGDRAREPQLVQSVPAETSLSLPGLPYAQDAWIEMIRNARSTIDTGQMYVADKAGEALDPVMKELEAAGARGVKIRIILSKNMWETDVPSRRRLEAIPGAQVLAMDLSQLTGGIIHAKYWIFDHQEIFIGSQNLDWRALSQIHELGVRMSDPAIVKQLDQVFAIDWQIAKTGKAPTPPAQVPHKDSEMELVASPPQFNPTGVRSSLPVLLDLIKSAHHTLQIQVMTYGLGPKNNPWREIDDALRAAASRGVKVELLVSHWNANSAAQRENLVSLSKVPNVDLRVITIPNHSSGEIPYARVIHSKYMVVDGQTLWLGTSNWERGYFYNTRGVELVFKSPKLARQCADIHAMMKKSQYASKLDN